MFSCMYIHQTFAHLLPYRLNIIWCSLPYHTHNLSNELLLPVLFVVSNQSVKEPRHNVEPVLMLLIIMSINGHYTSDLK